MVRQDLSDFLFKKRCVVLSRAFIFLLLVGIIFNSIFAFDVYGQINGKYDNNILKQSPNRKALPTGSVNETEYYSDELGWIEDENTLITGMKSFYNKTGVQPYLALIQPISTTNTIDECNYYAEQLYDDLFNDEGHLLLVYVASTNLGELGYLAYVCGTITRTVIDDEALDILYSNIDKYWFNASLSTEEMFSRAFSDTADTIMKQHTTLKDVLMLLVIFAVIFLLVLILITCWVVRTEKRNKAQEKLERTLNIPLEQFGDKSMDDIMKKYDD